MNGIKKKKIIYEFDFNDDIKKDENIIPIFMQYGNVCFEFTNSNNAVASFL